MSFVAEIFHLSNDIFAKFFLSYRIKLKKFFKYFWANNVKRYEWYDDSKDHSYVSRQNYS